MRKFVVPLFLFFVAIVFVMYSGFGIGSGEAAVSDLQAVKANGVAVPPFSVIVNRVRVTQKTMVSYPVYAVRIGTGTADEVTYVGYALADVFDAVGIAGNYTTVTVADGNGKSMQMPSKLAMESTTLLAVTKDGVSFAQSPWFAPCSSTKGAEYISAVASIEANGARAALPPPAPDPESVFGVDLNINMETIDYWLGLDDVVYRDLRLLFDPAAFEQIGGIADLTQTIKGFTIVPYPYIATLSALPVPGGYDGKALFSLTWHEDGSIASVTANYLESMVILEELFPVEKPIFLMCGGAGYSSEMKALLRYLGWNQELLYVVGPNWTYGGENNVYLVLDSQDPEVGLVYTTWRADYAYFEFDKLHPGTRLVERAVLKPINPQKPTCILDILAAKKASQS